MSALPRKIGSNSTGGLAAVAQQRAAAAALAKQSALPSPQFLDAINVLSEATMAEACALLLSEKDYENDSGGNSDYQRLLEIEKKCREAVKVVHKEAIPAPSANLMMPPSMPTIPAARVNTAVVKKTTTKTSMVTAPKTLVGKSITPTAGKPGVIPIRRGSLVGSRPAGLHGKRVMPQQLHRAESDDSSIGSGTSANKKAKVDAPPAAALNFLKQLNKTGGDSGSSTSKGDSKARNKEKDGNQKDSKEKPSSENNSDGDSIASEEDSERRRSPPSNRQPTRKNPARGARP